MPANARDFIPYGAPGHGSDREIPAGVLECVKPYKFIGFGAMDATKPYRFTGFGAMDATKPYKFIGF